MPQHTAHPRHVALKVNDSYVWLSRSQVSTLRRFDSDGVLDDWRRDSHVLRSLARHGWILRSRGTYVLTPQGRCAQAALADYLARKVVALKGGAAS